MKKKIFQFFICEALVCGALLGGCGSVNDGSAEGQEASGAEVLIESSVQDIREGMQEKGDEAVGENSTTTQQEMTENMGTADKQEIEYISVVMEEPSWEYYIAEEVESDTKPYKLTLEEEKENEIIDTSEWFVRNGLEMPGMEAVLDEKYFCGISGNQEKIVVNKEGEYGAELDFGDYMYANEINGAVDSLVQEPLTYAVVDEDILYVSNFHYTYAETEPANAYITAISLEDFSVLWRTAPLTCNSRNFVIIGDVIFCGYGFTSETDTLYQLDKKTGKVLASEPLKSMAEYILYQNDKLYVKTYNTDYIFSVEMN